MQVNNLAEGNLKKQILAFALPIIAGNLLQELYNVADTLIVGKTLGAVKLAAVGSTGPLVFLALGFFIGLSAGCSVISSTYFGAGDDRKLKQSVAAQVIIELAAAIMLTVLFVALVDPLLHMLKTTEDTFEYAATYLRIMFLGIPSIMLYNMGASLLRSVGDSRTPLMLLIFSSVLNIILDLAFIIVLGWDVAGAAIATVIAQFVSAGLCFAYIFAKVKILIPDRDSFNGISEIVKEEVKVGFPMGFQLSIIAAGMMALQYFINQFGSAAMAAFTIGNRLQLLIQNPLGSMSTVMATFTGQNNGAGNEMRIKKGLNYVLVICMIFAVVVGIITFIFGSKLACLFVSPEETQTIDYAVTFLRYNAPFEWTLALLFVYRGTLQGLQDGLTPMIGSFLEVAMRMLVPLIASEIIGFSSVCIAGPAAWTASAVLMIIVYYYKINSHINKG